MRFADINMKTCLQKTTDSVDILFVAVRMPIRLHLAGLKHLDAASSGRACRRLIRVLFHYIDQLQTSSFEALKTLGQTLGSWREEVAAMWRFTKSNGITEGFHTKMEMISRRAFGFKNFENYRLRVKALCA